MGKYVSDGKSSIASAITAKGVATAADATFATMVSNIELINSGLTKTFQRVSGTLTKDYKIIICCITSGNYDPSFSVGGKSGTKVVYKQSAIATDGNYFLTIFIYFDAKSGQSISSWTNYGANTYIFGIN